MKIAYRYGIWPLFLYAMFFTACGSSAPSGLSGSAVKNYDLTYDHIVIQRQESSGQPVALIILYVRNTSVGQEYPIKIVANWPVEQNIDKDIATDGSLDRFVQNQSKFPSMESGILHLDSLGDVGQSASGRFNITFADGKGTLNGEFSGIVESLSL